jgi:hypothetical protein
MKGPIVAGIVAGLACATAGHASELALKNPGFEASASAPEGWQRQQHVGVQAYEVTLDAEDAPEGKQSLRMKRIKQQVYGLVDQQLALDPAADGKILNYSAMLRTEAVGPGGWVLVVNFLTAGRAIIGQARSAPLSGDSDWQRITLRKPLPPHTRILAVGVMLLDGGTAWMDDVKVVLEDAVPQ